MNFDADSGIPRPRKPLNVFWVDTLEIHIPYNVISMEPGEFIQSGPYIVPLLKDTFYFQVSKISSRDVMVTCLRFPGDIPPDSGYLLRFYFSVVSINEGPKSVDMHFNENSASVFYKTNSFFLKLSEEKFRNYFFHLKVVMRMIEYTTVQNVLREIHEDVLKEVKVKYYKSESQIKAMAFLLRRPGLVDIFSGRQGDTFAASTLAVIARTAGFAEEIASYILAIGRGDSNIPNLNFRLILNYILHGNEEPITNEDLIVVFLKSYRLGLNFLKVVVTSFMVSNLQDLDFAIDVIQAANLVDDPLLFKEATDIFVVNLPTMLKSDKWQQLVNRSLLTANSIIHDIKVRLSFQELYIPPPFEEELEG